MERKFNGLSFKYLQIAGENSNQQDICHWSLGWAFCLTLSRGGCRMFPKGGRPVLDWCLNTIEWYILNGETPVPAPTPWIRACSTLSHRSLRFKQNYEEASEFIWSLLCLSNFSSSENNSRNLMYHITEDVEASPPSGPVMAPNCERDGEAL